jgi:membrane associated rhomboid family serine protease
MLGSIWDDVKSSFRNGDMVTRLIIVNGAFFVFIKFLQIPLYFLNGGSLPGNYYTFIQDNVAFSSKWWMDVTHPWTWLTYMFMHENIGHIFWNMLALYWFGSIVQDDLIGKRYVLPIYLYGGLAALVLFMLSSFWLGREMQIVGASGAVMALLVAAATKAPDYGINLMFLGRVPLKYVALALAFIDLLTITENSNTGGHFAHIGGMLMGWFFIKQLDKGNDLAEPLNNLFDRINDFWAGKPRKPKPNLTVAYRNEERRANTNTSSKSTTNSNRSFSNQEKIDRILEKIKREGRESLTDEEKETLFNASR